MAGRRRTTIGGQFAPRLIEMLESPAYRVLSLSAHRVLDRIEVELGHHAGIDNGRLPCTYDHFEEYGIHRHAIGPAIREAVVLGFIEVKRGSAGNAEHRAPNLFRLTYRPDYRGQQTDCWRLIKTLDDAMALATVARRGIPNGSYKKQNPSGGKRQISVPETTTENVNPQ